MPLVTVLVLCGCVAAGVGLGLLASLKLEAARRPEPPHTTLIALNVGLVAALLAAGLAVDFFGVQTGLIAGASLLGLALFGLIPVPPSARAAPLLAAAALGVAALYLALLELMPAGLLGAGEVAASLLFGSVFLGLGALLARPLFDVLVRAGGYRVAMALLGASCAALAVLAAVTPADAYPDRAGDLLKALTTPKLWLAAVVLAVYVALESFVSLWVTKFLGTRARPGDDEPEAPTGPDLASSWIAWFWLALLGSRVLVAVVQHFTIRDDWQPAFLVFPALLAAVVLGNLSGSTHTRRALSGVVFMGLALGPVLPVLLAIMTATLHRAGAGLGLGFALLHLGAAVGGVVFAPLVRMSAEGRTAQSALQVPLFLALLLTAATVLFALTA